MPVAHGGTVVSAGSGVSSLTFSLTTTGTEILVIAGTSTFDTATADDVSGVTWDGTAMTAVENVLNDDVRATMWKFENSAAKTANIVITFATSTRTASHASYYTGTASSSALGTPATATGLSATPSVAVTSASGELVIDNMGWADGTTTATVDGSQTQRANHVSTADTNHCGEGVSEEAGAASVTMSWSLSVSELWATIGVGVKPPAAAGRTAKNTHPWTLGVNLGMSIGFPGHHP